MDRKDQKFQELKQQVLEIKDDYAGKIKGGGYANKNYSLS